MIAVHQLARTAQRRRSARQRETWSNAKALAQPAAMRCEPAPQLPASSPPDTAAMPQSATAISQAMKAPVVRESWSLTSQEDLGIGPARPAPPSQAAAISAPINAGSGHTQTLPSALPLPDAAAAAVEDPFDPASLLHDAVDQPAEPALDHSWIASVIDQQKQLQEARPPLETHAIAKRPDHAIFDRIGSNRSDVQSYYAGSFSIDTRLDAFAQELRSGGRPSADDVPPALDDLVLLGHIATLDPGERPADADDDGRPAAEPAPPADPLLQAEAPDAPLVDTPTAEHREIADPPPLDGHSPDHDQPSAEENNHVDSTQ